MGVTTADAWGRLSLMVLASLWLVPSTLAWTSNSHLPVVVGHSSSNTALEMVRTRGLEQRREGATPTGACLSVAVSHGFVCGDHWEASS